MTDFAAWITDPTTIPDLLGPGDAPSRASSLADRRSPMFPEDRPAFFAIKEGILSGRLHGLQVDPLTWAALMTKAEIVAFLADVYGPPGRYESQYEMSALEHLAGRMRELRAFVVDLPDDELFAVMADEF